MKNELPVQCFIVTTFGALGVLHEIAKAMLASRLTLLLPMLLSSATHNPGDTRTGVSGFRVSSPFICYALCVTPLPEPNTHILN